MFTLTHCHRHHHRHRHSYRRHCRRLKYCKLQAKGIILLEMAGRSAALTQRCSPGSLRETYYLRHELLWEKKEWMEKGLLVYGCVCI